MGTRARPATSRWCSPSSRLLSGQVLLSGRPAAACVARRIGVRARHYRRVRQVLAASPDQAGRAPARRAVSGIHARPARRGRGPPAHHMAPGPTRHPSGLPESFPECRPVMSAGFRIRRTGIEGSGAAGRIRGRACQVLAATAGARQDRPALPAPCTFPPFPNADRSCRRASVSGEPASGERRGRPHQGPRPPGARRARPALAAPSTFPPDRPCGCSERRMHLSWRCRKAPLPARQAPGLRHGPKSNVKRGALAVGRRG